MTKSELAAQKCADLFGGIFTSFNVRRFVEHVSDLCEHAITSGDTSGLEELVLREPVDVDLLEARKLVAERYEAAGNSHEFIMATLNGADDHTLAVQNTLQAIRRGREIERGEDK